jgi:hypothetical protein
MVRKQHVTTTASHYVRGNGLQIKHHLLKQKIVYLPTISKKCDLNTKHNMQVRLSCENSNKLRDAKARDPNQTKELIPIPASTRVRAFS